MTKADVLRVAKEHFLPQEFTYVAVGNPQKFGTPLSALNLKVEPIDLTIPEPKQAAAKTDSASLAKGKQLLQRVQQSLGGADKLASVKDLEYHAEVEVESPSGKGMQVKQTNSYLFPATMRQEIVLPFGKQSMYSNGSSGWLASMQGVRDLPPPVLGQVRGEVFREILGLTLSDRDSNRTVNSSADGVLDISSKSGERVQLQVDEKTGVPLKLSYQEPGAGGSVEQTYSDWRDVGGVRLPFQWTVIQGGKKYAEVKVQDYRLNSGLTEETLSKKP